uniref:GDP-fucose protein O-fucosyltransferase 1 n=1 Tax=Rhabditophanes sp. KR3021 TaxID=114890 RepID=A0AC35UHI2_9BILA
MSANFFEDTMEKQKLLLNDQDEDLERVGTSLSTIKHMSYRIGEELDDHNELLEELDIEMRNTDIKMDNVMKKIAKVASKTTWVLLFFIISILGQDVDLNGYVMYCPCMGRFGNQMEQFLGAMNFAKTLNRTLILPPFVQYEAGKATAKMVDFENYFQVKPLEQFHRVIPMRLFMKSLSETIWPEIDRKVLCWNARKSIFDETLPLGCHSTEGNPYGPFWSSFNIKFVNDEYFGNIQGSFVNTGRKLKQDWDDKFPSSDYKVLAFTTPPGQFPSKTSDHHIQQYIRWNSRVTSQAKAFIDQHLPRPFIGIHLRNNDDWSAVCKHVDPKTKTPIFASEQCTGVGEQIGPLTKEVCEPSKETILHDIEKLVRESNFKAIYVSSDKDHMIDDINDRLSTYEVKAFKLKNDDPIVSLAILQASNHFIGNCVSSYSSFVNRARANSAAKASRPTTFFGFTPATRRRKIEL